MSDPQMIRRRQAIGAFISLLLCGVLLCLFWVEPTLREWRQREFHVLMLREQLAQAVSDERRLQALLANAPDAAEAEAIGSESLLLSDAPNVVLAELQNRIRELVIGSGGLLESIDSDILLEGQPLPQIRITLRSVVRIGELRNILYQLQEFRPMLFIDQMWLSARNLHSNAMQEPKIEIRLILFSYLGASSVANAEAASNGAK